MVLLAFPLAAPGAATTTRSSVFAVEIWNAPPPPPVASEFQKPSLPQVPFTVLLAPAVVPLASQ
jgi:hypothetical protein